MPHNSPVPRSFGKHATTARQREAIRLLANGVKAKDAGQMLGGISENGVWKLWNRALRAQAKEMRDADAYERGLALVMLRLEALLATWLAKGIAGDKDGADVSLRTIALIMRVCGYDSPATTRPPGDPAGTGDDPAPATTRQLDASTVAGVLDRLEDIAKRINPAGAPVIEGQLAEQPLPEQEKPAE